MSDTEQCPKSPWKSKRHKWQDENGKYTIPETCHWCGMRQDSHPTSQPKPVDGELREKIHEIHGRLHGREITHKEVAKHSHWTPEELQSVLIEDAEIFAEEMQDLFDAHLQAAVREAERKAALQALMSLDIDTESSAGRTIDAEIARLRNKL